MLKTKKEGKHGEQGNAGIFDISKSMLVDIVVRMQRSARHNKVPVSKRNKQVVLRRCFASPMATKLRIKSKLPTGIGWIGESIL